MLANPVAHESGASFPSGHAQAAVVGYAVLLLVFLPVLHGAARRVAIGVAVLMVLGIGLSRVALGVHYVSDVLAGYVLGAAWVVAMIASFNVWRRRTACPAPTPKRAWNPNRWSGCGEGMALPMSGDEGGAGDGPDGGSGAGAVALSRCRGHRGSGSR